jgi:putative intracellular protease/amidase
MTIFLINNNIYLLSHSKEIKMRKKFNDHKQSLLKVLVFLFIQTISTNQVLAITPKGNNDNKNKRIVFILSAHHSGYWLPEVIKPYQDLTVNGYQVTFASPQGAPGHPAAFSQLSEKHRAIYRQIEPVLATPQPLKSIRSKDYEAIYFPGGSGPVFDLAGHPEVNRLVLEFYNENKIIAALCHGPAALTYVKLPNGERLITGLNITGKSNAEEPESAENWYPFLIENRFKAYGSNYSSGGPNQAYIVYDEPVLTGQNPQSTSLLSNKLINLLSNYKETK